MKNTYRFLVLILLSNACTSDKLTFQPTEISFDHFPFLTGVYQTTDSIQAYFNRTQRSSLTAHFYNQIGKNQAAAELYDSQQPIDTFVVNTDSLLQIYQPFPAIDFITAQAKNHQITIINEAHHVPQHRVFTEQLLTELYAVGYRHLGLETLVSTFVDSTLNERPYVTLKDGTYTLEPRFANMVRTAKRIGYQIFPYERISGRGKFREMEQAQHIADYHQRFPDDKILIHCGYNHVMEGEYGGRWEYAMAERVKRLTNLDPLTIDQTQYRERGNPQQEHPLYAAISLTKPSVLLDKTSS